MSIADSTYRALPIWAQNLALSAYGLYWRQRRLGGKYLEHVAAFRAREKLPADEMDAYVASQLCRLLMNAYEEVPYYKEAWPSAGISRRALETQPPADLLEKLPITRKEAVRRDPEAFLAQNLGKGGGLGRYLTSGSSGTPVTAIWRAEHHRQFVAAREVRSFNWAGTTILGSRSTIGGRMVVPRASSKGPFHRYNAIEKHLYLSAFHISPDNVPAYVQALERYQPRVLTGYAHSHFTLARMILEQGRTLEYEPEALILGSEKMTSEMRHVITEAFGARAFEEYGCVENCVLATECEEGRLHVSMDFGVLEILDEEGKPVPPGVEGRVICTGLLNDVQPLVRYEVGDLAKWSADECPCGRNQFPVIEEITGRLEDVVVGPDGREMVRFHGIFVGLPGVSEGQVIQKALDRIQVRIVPTNEFTSEERDIIIGRIQERLGPVLVEVETVGTIERTGRGKFRAVISEISPKGS